ncbi:MAG: hypothetical protein FJX75_22060 [Armatimonadetes bacterium]|nr:hypothetical protein [Armatimonadota bacterium]
MSAKSPGPDAFRVTVPVSGTVPLTPWEWALLQTEPMRRLQRIRQLEASELVFPGATHTRYEHSIGCLALVQAASRATAWVASIAKTYGIAPTEATAALALAALTHDLGQGACSHLAERILERHGVRHVGVKCSVVGLGTQEASVAIHEYVSASMVTPDPANDLEVTNSDKKHAALLRATASHRHQRLEETGIWKRKGAPGKRVRRAAARLIIGLPREAAHFSAGTIDFDRLDFLQRDAHATGVGFGNVDASRICATALMRAQHGIPAIDERKGLFAAEHMLVSRQLMYEVVCFHPLVSLACDLIVRAFEEVSKGWAVDDIARKLFTWDDPALWAVLRDADGDAACAAVHMVESRRLYRQAVRFRWRELHPRLRRQMADAARGGRLPSCMREQEDALNAKLSTEVKGGHLEVLGAANDAGVRDELTNALGKLHLPALILRGMVPESYADGVDDTLMVTGTPEGNLRLGTLDEFSDVAALSRQISQRRPALIVYVHPDLSTVLSGLPEKARRAETGKALAQWVAHFWAATPESEGAIPG